MHATAEGAASASPAPPAAPAGGEANTQPQQQPVVATLVTSSDFQSSAAGATEPAQHSPAHDVQPNLDLDNPEQDAELHASTHPGIVQDTGDSGSSAEHPMLSSGGSCAAGGGDAGHTAGDAGKPVSKQVSMASKARVHSHPGAAGAASTEHSIRSNSTGELTLGSYPVLCRAL